MGLKEWTQTTDSHGRPRFDRSDGAVVKYDQDASTNTSKPWLPGHRGWLAFGPGTNNHNYLLYRNRRGLGIPLKFKTAENAIRAVEARHPFKA